MKNKILAYILLIVGIITINTNNANAFSTSYYASHSKLSSGKWVKIKVTTTGVNEITNEQLVSWGFPDPAKVRIFGEGGDALSEILTTSMPDDLEQVPIYRTADKIMFYGTTGCKFSTTYTTTTPVFTPEVNPYSLHGYYFLTDANYPELSIEKITLTNAGSDVVDSGINYAYHEPELANVGETGKMFFGEDFGVSNRVEFSMKMPGIIADSTIICTTALACRSTGNTFFYSWINNDSVKYTLNTNLTRAAMGQYDYFKWAKSTGTFRPTSHVDTAKVVVKLKPAQLLSLAKFDFMTLSYYRKASLLGGLNQCQLFLPNVVVTDKLQFTDSDSNMVLWNLSNPKAPVQYAMEIANQDGVYTGSCTMAITSNWLPIVAFNQKRAQYPVEFVESVPNQDIHAMAVPDMLIVTTPTLIPYAQEIADIHKANDNMDVAIVEQGKIFNEFSSGRPDATAIRRAAKMFWDKNPQKFKYMLMFGGGSYDNRNLKNNLSPNLLLTFQSKESSSETESYVTDDYFGFLNDNSGTSFIADKLCIGIGRMPVINELEARNAVDKLLNFVNNPNHKSWNNEALIVADEGESYLFSYQSEGLEKLFNDSLSINYHINKIYVDAFTKDKQGTASEANKKMRQMFASGQAFASYIGHGGPTGLTYSAKLWTPADVTGLTIDNLPILTLATCDVARFDSGARGIAETMFHQPSGGAVALMASTRTVYATENDALNRAFIRGLFTPNDDGSYPTVGDAMKYGKLSFLRGSLNKLNFFLLGDPAMRLHYPTSKVAVTSIDNLSPTAATFRPLSKSTIKGNVLDANGKVDNNFNGEATITIYNPKTKFGDLNIGTKYPVRTSYICNDQLCQFSAPVVNGLFTVDCILPQYSLTSESLSALTAYVFDSSTGKKCSTLVKDIPMGNIEGTPMIVDNVSPTIDAMYLNDESFKNGDELSDSPTVYVRATDNYAFNMNLASISGNCRLTLDNKNSYSDVKDYITYSPDGKSALLKLKLDNLSYGKHTLEFRISDIANNSASAIVSFYYVGSTKPYELEVVEYPAREHATFDLASTESKSYTEAVINVVDSNDKLIWQGTTSSFPYEWNLLDSKGKRVAPGVYNYYASFKGDNIVGTSQVKKIIIVKQ